MAKGKFSECNEDSAWCYKCKKCKLLSEFYVNNNRVKNVNSRCKECDKEALQERRGYATNN